MSRPADEGGDPVGSFTSVDAMKQALSVISVSDDGGEAPLTHHQVEVCGGNPGVSLSSNVRCFALNKADIDPIRLLALTGSCLHTKMLMLCSPRKGCWSDSELSGECSRYSVYKVCEYSGDASVCNERDVDEVLHSLEAGRDSIITANSHKTVKVRLPCRIRHPYQFPDSPSACCLHRSSLAA